MLSLIPYADLPPPLLGKILLGAGSNVYTGCGYTVFVVWWRVMLGWASAGLAACPGVAAQRKPAVYVSVVYPAHILSCQHTLSSGPNGAFAGYTGSLWLSARR